MVTLYSWVIILKLNYRDTEKLLVKIILHGLRVVKYT
nr:MAG TPA: hypothetical protein [Crassvirales sp.]DAP79154.1 MAG TPA: hypothetical protein [Caudoviricetes sp.]DAV84172.1 MAG TPA: hypothetical protein [Caudoviricetes sp.]